MSSTAHEPLAASVTTLIERSEQLGALERYRADAAAGRGRFVVVRGEAGIGKTALARAFLHQLSGAARTIETHCENLSTPRPFASLHEAVPIFGPQLARLLAGSASRAEIAAWLLDRLSSSGMQVWLLEDLQWADDATLDLIGYLARRIDRASVLLIATYRDEQLPRPALSFALGELATAAAVRHIAVPALSRDGVEQLARGRHAAPDELHRLTNGNSFYVTEVLTAGGEPLPASVRDAIRARLNRLDERARRALEAAAVLGSTVEPWLLAAVSGEDLPGIDDCLAAGVVASENGRIDFRHELTRMTVLEDLPVFRGIGLHRRALDALGLAGEGDEARLAYHAEGAADGAAVLRHGDAAAAQSLAMRAYREAGEQLRRCLRFAPRDAGDQRLALLQNLAHALFMTGELADADAFQSEAVAVSREIGDAEALGRNTRRLARHRLFSRGAADALPVAIEALHILEPLGETRELALTYCAIGHVHMVAQHADEVAAWSTRALGAGRRLEDPEVVAYALTDLGSAELFSGNPAGSDKLLEALAIAKAARLTEHVDRALINLCETAVHNRELDHATTWLQETAEFNAASQIALCDLNWMWASVHLEHGRWDDAARSAETCMSRQKPSPGEKARAAMVLAAVAFRRNASNAAASLAAAEALISRDGALDLQVRWPLAALHAEAAWIAGDMAMAADDLLAAYAQAIEHGDPWAIGDLGRWLWRAGVPTTLDSRAAKPYALQVAGDWRGAMQEWTERGIPYEAALCLGDSTDPADLREAHTRLLALGADGAARRMGMVLRSHGAVAPRGPRRTTRAHPAGLTLREAEVATLAADGMTNREIAGRLVLTEKTVSHHVSSILAKLGARRRVDIGSRLTAPTERGAAVPT